MTHRRLRLLAAALACALPAAVQAGKYDYPKAKTVEQVDEFFGTKVADPYRWLEDVDDPEVQAWVDAENSVTRGVIDKIPFREQVAKRLTELLDYPRVGLPVERGPWTFFSKNTGLQNQSVIYKQNGRNGAPATLLDPNVLAKDGTISVTTTSYSNDGKWMAYTLSQSGSDWTTLHVRDVATAKDRSEVLQRCRFTDIAWLADGSGFYYSRYPDAGSVPKGDEEFWQKLYFHKLGDKQAKDQLVYERPDCRDCGESADVTEDGRWLIVHVWKGTAPENEVFVQRLQPAGTIEPLFTGFEAGWTFVEAVGEKLYFLTDKDAPRGRVVTVDMAGDKTPKTIVPQLDDVIDSAKIANAHLVLSNIHNA